MVVKPVLEVSEGTPAVYSNFIEVTSTPWDFALVIGRVPPKGGPDKLAQMRETGLLTVPAEMTINLPATIIPGLIRALSIQRELFEKRTGIELKEGD